MDANNLLSIEKAHRCLLEGHEKRRALMDDLAKSIALAQLWPDVFEAGGATSVWFEPPGYVRSGRHSGRMPEHPHARLHFRVTSGAGAAREYPFMEVPAVLGGGFHNET
jgi:hypothetical protein